MPRSGLWLLALLSRSVFVIRVPKRYADRQMRRSGGPRMVSVEGGRDPSPRSPRPPHRPRCLLSFSSSAATVLANLTSPSQSSLALLVPCSGRGSTELRCDEVRTALILCRDLGRCAAPLSVA